MDFLCSRMYLDTLEIFAQNFRKFMDLMKLIRDPSR